MSKLVSVYLFYTVFAHIAQTLLNRRIKKERKRETEEERKLLDIFQ